MTPSRKRRRENADASDLKRLQYTAESQKSGAGAFYALGTELSVLHISGESRHDFLTEEDPEALIFGFVERQTDGVGTDVDDCLFHSYDHAFRTNLQF